MKLGSANATPDAVRTSRSRSLMAFCVLRNCFGISPGNFASHESRATRDLCKQWRWTLKALEEYGERKSARFFTAQLKEAYTFEHQQFAA
jgi:hypothetical protein